MRRISASWPGGQPASKQSSQPKWPGSPIAPTISRPLSPCPESLRNLAIAAEQGKGLAGKLFSDEELASNFAVLSSNLVETSTKLNRNGLWGILWKDKEEKSDDSTPKKPGAAGGRNRR